MKKKWFKKKHKISEWQRIANLNKECEEKIKQFQDSHEGKLLSFTDRDEYRNRINKLITVYKFKKYPQKTVIFYGYNTCK